MRCKCSIFPSASPRVRTFLLAWSRNFRHNNPVPSVQQRQPKDSHSRFVLPAALTLNELLPAVTAAIGPKTSNGSTTCGQVLYCTAFQVAAVCVSGKLR